MEEAESEEAVPLGNEVSEMAKSICSIALPSKVKSVSKRHKLFRLSLTKGQGLSKMVSLGEPKPSCFVTRSLSEMANEDPIRLQNQSYGIREGTVKSKNRERLIYSSLARLSTLSVGLCSTEGEDPSGAPLRKSSVDAKDKSPPRYFQMPQLGARVFVGDVDGSDTIACHLFHRPSYASKINLDSEYAALRSLYKDDRPGGLRGWVQPQPAHFWRDENHFSAILSGTELFVPPGPYALGGTMVGNLGGKSSSVFDIQPRAPIPVVRYNPRGHWESFEGACLLRSTEGSYLEEPKFMDKKNYQHPELDHTLKGDVLQLTRFDDFVILGNVNLHWLLPHYKVNDIVRKNASQTVDVIASQIVKATIEEDRTMGWHPITVIVVVLDHKEILLREHKKEKKENMATKEKAILGLKGISQSLVSKDDKKIVKLKEEEMVTTSKEEEKIFASKKEDEKQIRKEEDHYKVKILVGEPLPNVVQTSTSPLEENEFGMKKIAISSNLTSAKIQDDSEASSSIVLIEDVDCKGQDLVSHHITKWIIYEDLLERILLCFFNIEEMQYEFYFEDHESMATIVGLGVPHSKVIVECGSPHVTVVEIPKDEWDVVWAHSNDILCSMPRNFVLKHEIFFDILHHIANVMSTNSIVSKTNNGGVEGDNGKGKSQGNANNGKGKEKATHDHDDYGNVRHPPQHPYGGSNGVRDNNDNQKREGKDGNDDKKDGHHQDDGKTFNDCKEVQAVVHLRFLPEGVCEDKRKSMKLGKIHKEVVEGKKKELGEIHEEEVVDESKELQEIHKEVEDGKKKELGEVHEEEVEEKTKELGEGCKRVEKKKKKILKALWQIFKRGENENVFGNQERSTTMKRVENGDVDENLQKQLENQIHSKMVFTFTIKDEVGGPLKTIQATIKPITFQFPPDNEDNYLQRCRFGWFHEKLQVAFGVVNTQVAYLDAESCKVLDPSEVKEVKSHGNSKGNARTSTNAYKGKMGIKHGLIASGEYDRTNGLESKTTEEVHNSWESNKILTEGSFLFKEHTDLNSQQLKYSYFPHFPFNEKEFEVKDKGGRLEMYQNPICHLQRVSCEGTWYPYHSDNLEAYKLEASRELGMTRIYNLELEAKKEKRKGVQKVEGSMPLCFIQKLEKVVYLNHAMSHLTSSTTGVYRLQEQQDPTSPSTTFLTQAQRKEELEWPSNDSLVDVKQNRNI